jgi:SNF2 family DNA or RNA helicase
LPDYVYKTPPYAHQRQIFEASRDREYCGLLLEMGTGKSKILVDTLAWLHQAGKIKAAVIVAPKSVCRTWSQIEFLRHWPEHADLWLALWTGGTTRAEQEQLRDLLHGPDEGQLRVLVVNVEALSQGTRAAPGKAAVLVEAFLRKFPALLAVDESTTVKSPDARRTKNVLRLARLAKYRRVLTGTPVTQSPLDLYCQLEMLGDPQRLTGCSSWFAFRARYAELRRRVINGRSFDEVVGYRRLDELQRLVGQVSYRRLKSECLDLPPKVYQTREVALGAEQRRIYEDLRDRAVAELSALQVVTAPLVITRLLRLRQVLAGIVPSDDGSEAIIPNNPRFNELIQILGETQGKVIIWCSFVATIKTLVALINPIFGLSAAAFYGNVPAAQRQDIVDRFQDPADPLRFFVGQVRTGGLGLTLTAANLVIYHDHDWSLEARAQSEDRAHRIGQERSVTYVDLVAPGTVDEAILGALREKKDLADLVTGDGWRRLLCA